MTSDQMIERLLDEVEARIHANSASTTTSQTTSSNPVIVNAANRTTQTNNGIATAASNNETEVGDETLRSKEGEGDGEAQQ